MHSPETQAGPSVRIHAAVALLSAALLAFQLTLMQLFALVQWHHYAFLVISIAMTGFGASGTVFALLRTRMLAVRETLLPALASLSAVLMIVCTAAALLVTPGFDPFLLFTDAGQGWRLLLTCILLFLPFLPGALVLVITFAAWPARIGGLYLSNLAGSGAGGMLAVLLPWLLAPQLLPSAAALCATFAAFLLLRPHPRVLLLMPAGAALLGLLSFPLFPPPEISSYKALPRSMDLPGAELTFSGNSPYGMLHVVRAPAMRHAPGLSLTYTGDIPVRDAVFRNGNMLGALAGMPDGDAPPLLAFTTRALPYALGSVRRVLLLESGTGEEAALALSRGARTVAALQPDGLLRGLLRGALAPPTDSIFLREELRLKAMDARRGLAQKERYDLIVHPVVESMGGSAGLQALQEEYTLTVEAFAAMWRRLTPDGRIEITVWMDYPWRSTLRLPATLAEMLEREGVEVRRHLLAVRGWGTLTFVVSRRAVSPEGVARVRAFCERLQFDPALLPGVRAGERQRYHVLGEAGFFRALDALTSPSRDTFIEAYPFRIAPATDDRPFFSQFLTPASLEVIAEEAGRAAVPAMELGSVTVLAAVAVVSLLAFVFIILPLLSRGMRRGARAWTFLHFTTIGLGFMFVEILLLHHFVRYFGNPVYAASAVITALLLCAGMGSWYSGLRTAGLQRAARGQRTPGLRWTAELRRTEGTQLLPRVCAAIAVLLFAGVPLLPPLLTSTMGLALPLKALLAFAVVFPAGFLMGMPFPLGIGVLAARAPSHIPWAWAVNGSTSVLSTGLATLLALQCGFSVVLGAAAGMYGIAAAAGWLGAGGSKE